MRIVTNYLTRAVSAALLAAALVSTGAAPASAQGYRARVHTSLEGDPEPVVGWYLGFGVHGTAIVRQTGGPESLGRGGGISLVGGFHVHPRATVELGITESLHNPATVDTIFGRDLDYLALTGVTLGSRIYADNAAGPVSPYLQVGLGAYSLSSDYMGLDSTGAGFHVGLGVDFWLGDAMAVGVRARYRSIAMGPPEGGNSDTFLTTTLLEAGFSFHF